MGEKKILVCDDDDTLVGLLESLLETAGYDVITAEDGFECVEKFVSEKPDLLILDLDMPRKTGFDVLDDLKRRGEAGNGVPVFVLSGRERQEDVQRASQFGVVGYITKPFSGESFLQRVRDAFSR